MASWDPASVIGGGAAGGGLLIVLIACIGGFLHARRGRLLVHAERMKALELGREMPDDPATARLKAIHQIETPEAEESPSQPKSLANQCYSTTGYVCGCGFVFAWMAQSNHGVAIASAAATGAIGVTGMICGTVLAAKSTASNESRSLAHAKPMFDPEAV